MKSPHNPINFSITYKNDEHLKAKLIDFIIEILIKNDFFSEDGENGE